jgi:hypothetical protein
MARAWKKKNWVEGKGVEGGRHKRVGGWLSPALMPRKQQVAHRRQSSCTDGDRCRAMRGREQTRLTTCESCQTGPEGQGG